MDIDDAPDFRLQRMDSPEGHGNARARWSIWIDHNEDLVAETSTGQDSVRLDDEEPSLANDIAGAILEETELIGFWIAWHRAGGFANLEYAGWHRATIFRKLRRFRAHFGAHPDEYRFEWITLDLPMVWERSLLARLEPEPDHD